jgi:hypothetical protein
VFRGKFIALKVKIRQKKIPEINNLNFNLKLAIKGQIISKTNEKEKII